MRKVIITLTCVLFAVSTAVSQQLSIKGIVTDANDQPIPYAHLSSKKLSQGTFTNESGQFRFTTESSNFPLELDITHIGYHPVQLEVSLDEDLKIILKESTQILNEVIVSAMTASRVLEKSLQFLEENTISNPIYITSFVREQLFADSLIYTGEALTKTYSVPYFDFIKDNQTRIVKGRYSSLLPDSAIAKLPEIVNGVNAAVGLDIIRKRPDFLPTKKNREYEFSFCEKEENTTEYFCISFEAEGSRYGGHLFIHKSNFFLKRIEMNLSQKGLDQFKSKNLEVLSFELTCEYEYISRAGVIMNLANLNSKFYYNGNSFNLEMVSHASEFQFENVTPFWEDELHNTSFERAINLKDDSLFWKDQNVLLPEKN